MTFDRGLREFNFRNSLFFTPESFEEPLRLSKGGSVYGGRGELFVVAAIIYLIWYQRKRMSRKLDAKIRPAFKTDNRFEVLKLQEEAHLPYSKL